MKLQHTPPVHSAFFSQAQTLNPVLINAFDRELRGEHVRESHFELGRYENTYIQRTALPELEQLIEAAVNSAQEILKQESLKIGFWFNAMQPGQRTLRHNHDEEDELLSCVYYINVPENSGDLLIHHTGGCLRIKPEEGKFVFFSPRLAHEVERNCSEQRRLSIAFNFGNELID